MGEQEQRIFWLNGLAGIGKSTIAQTFAEMTFADGQLEAQLLLSTRFPGPEQSSGNLPNACLTTRLSDPPFRNELLQVLKASPDAGCESLCSQMEKLIIGLLKVTHTPTLIIIDALDECKGEQPASAILSMLVNEIPTVKFFIVGWPEARIRTGFQLRSLLPIAEVFKLHEVKPGAVDSDIEMFFQTQLTNLIEN